jgi:hypothetical protein
VLVFVLANCGTRSVSIEGFDSRMWKDDRSGCDGTRPEQANHLLNQRQSLLGIDELDVVSVLGKPDQTELYTRNQKFYYYYVEPSPDCNRESTAGAKRLEIRFNAVGLVNEVNLVE